MTAAHSTTWPKNTGWSREPRTASDCRSSGSFSGADRRKTALAAFSEALGELTDLLSIVTCSVHKEPVAAAGILQRMVQEVPDSVVIAYIGRSNGAGPTLSAMTTISVITVPASVREFPDDIWSSLRAPSSVPVMTVLEPANAVLAALQILSARNPRLYARLRGEIENRTVNTIRIDAAL